MMCVLRWGRTMSFNRGDVVLALFPDCKLKIAKKRPWVLIGTMLLSVALSFWSAEGIVEAPYGVPQIVLFAASTVVAGFGAYKAFSANNIWAVGIGCLVVVYLAGLFYLLMIY
jgi:hypothetical protein